jgi:hypothetical protein
MLESASVYFTNCLNLYSMAKSPEIESLKQYFKRNSISVEQDMNINPSHFVLVNLTIDSKTWEILVDDEYGDFNAKN